MRSSRALAFRSILVVSSVLLAAGAGELAARVIDAALPVRELRGLHELRPDRGWVYGLRPGAEGRLPDSGDVPYRINEDGFRGPRHARPKPAGVFRIVVMGDSVSFGYGVAEPESWPRLLEASLDGQASGLPGPEVEVVNLGVGGYNAFNEARLFEDVGLGYQPDLVLVQFCINDLNDPTLHFDAQTRLHLADIPDEAFPDPSKRRITAREPSAWLRACRRSRLCAGLDDLRLALATRDPDDEMRRAAGVPVDRAGPEWDWLEARYLEMAAAAARGGARFAVLAFPYRAQLGGPDPHPVQERLGELASRHGWLLVDPLPAFRSAQRGEPLFLDWWHPTPAGHRAAAQETLRVLACDAGLLPVPRGACLGRADAAPSG